MASRGPRLRGLHLDRTGNLVDGPAGQLVLTNRVTIPAAILLMIVLTIASSSPA